MMAAGAEQLASRQSGSVSAPPGNQAVARLPGALRDPALFINRELSWLEFNERVLEESRDPALPIPERLKFLGIVSSNLDEFFMVRVAGLKRQIAGGVAETAVDGLLPIEQLAAVSARVHKMVAEQYQLWRDEIAPRLSREYGVRLVRPADLTPDQADAARVHFRQKVFPALTPLANDHSHPFPQLRNKSLTLAVHLPRASGRSRRRRTGVMAVVGIPASLSRLVPVGPFTYALLEDLVARHVGELFAGAPDVRTAAFRVTRNWDLEVDEEEAEDLLSAIKAGVRDRDRGAPVRLEIASDGFKDLTAPLADQLGLNPGDVYEVEGPLQIQDLATLIEVIEGDPRHKPRVKVPPEPALLATADSIFDIVANQDVVIHHPYESFEPVVRFIEEAAEDPQVKAIKQVLYRTGTDSPFVRGLLRAAENGKEVAVFLEIKARFDEKANIGWVEKLRNAGAMVVYGYDACKTHCKVALVVRTEGDALRNFVHIGTGNYNPVTARVYTDVSLLTSRSDIVDEVQAVFNMLTANVPPQRVVQLDGAAPPPGAGPFRRIAVAPHGLKERLLSLIADEAQHASQGRPARILAKMNSLVDADVIEALYAAGQAGVRVDLLVRGICCLRPGVPGVSERIRVHSVVDRYLEHSRIFVFGEGKRGRVYVSSADWMPRNFVRRVEIMAPVDDATLKTRLVEIIEAGLADNVKGRVLRSDGRYERIVAGAGEAPVRSQYVLEPAQTPDGERRLLGSAIGVAAP